jgi:Ni/Fe-hydrogenase subunit HybB-like protein
MTSQAQPIGGYILTKPFKLLLLIFAISIVVIAWRFWSGIGPVSGLSDGYPWGIWIAFDVVTGTSFACGGYAVALLVFILNRGRYHPLVRPAVLTSALGYTIAGMSLAVDVGRPWNFWRVPIFFWQWNFDSALLEVALCIMSYIGVLWIEVSPAILERLQDQDVPWLPVRRVAAVVSRVVDKALVWFIALGLLLPTMHQSSLGTLMILTGHKLHPLWQTPLLPLLFLISCIVMGYGTVVFESLLSSTAFKRPRETRMLGSLSVTMVVVLFLFLGLRLFDLAWRGSWRQVAGSGGYGLLLLFELALFLVPALMLLSKARREDPGHLFRAGMLMMLAGALYRFDSVLIAFRPGEGWSYFPTVPEMTITLGLVALEIMVYLVLVRTFPILRGIAPARAGHQGA